MRSAGIAPSQAVGRWAQGIGRGAVAGVVALILCGTGAPARAAEAGVYVLLDRAQVMPFPDTTETVIVGNPIIADVTMLRNSGEVILTGKGFGDTNLLFLDGRGTVLREVRLRVREAPSMMVVQRGTERETYACHPRCEPTVSLGDSTTFLQRAIGDIQSRNAQATGAASSGGSPH